MTDDKPAATYDTVPHVYYPEAPRKQKPVSFPADTVIAHNQTCTTGC